MFSEKLNIPGEHDFTFMGEAGLLEGKLLVPDRIASTKLAILGHPHPLYGGTMQNKVVTTLSRSFRDNGIPSLRFNFRGVGKSEGVHDAGKGETKDMLILSRLCQNELPEWQRIYAGFSFGSHVAYAAAARDNAILLVTVAPAVHHYDYTEFSPKPYPWYVIQGELDEVVDPNLVYEFAEDNPSITLIRVPDATHFFHGKLLILSQHVTDLLSSINLRT